MPIPFTCPHCGKPNTVPDQYAGMSVKCTACGQPVMIPGSPLGSFAGSNTPPPPKKKSGGAALVVILVVIAAVCGGGVLLTGVLAALLLPAFHSAREAARRNVCERNLQQVGLAMQNHELQRGDLPPLMLTDQNGEPRHSWRTLLLPYVEHQGLYRRIKLEESWNSADNMRWGSEMQEVYLCPSSQNSKAPSFFAVEGEFAPLQPLQLPANVQPNGIRAYQSKTSFVDIQDGLSNTVATFEVEGATSHWMQPVNLAENDLNKSINAAKDGRSVSSQHVGGVNVVLLDARVRFIRNQTPTAVLKNMADRRDGQLIDLAQFE